MLLNSSLLRLFLASVRDTARREGRVLAQAGVALNIASVLALLMFFR